MTLNKSNGNVGHHSTLTELFICQILNKSEDTEFLSFMCERFVNCATCHFL